MRSVSRELISSEVPSGFKEGGIAEAVALVVKH